MEGAEVTIPVIEIDVIMVTATGIRTMDPEVTADNTIAIGVIIGITDVTGITDLSRPTEGTIPIKVETTIIEAVTGIRTMDPTRPTADTCLKNRKILERNYPRKKMKNFLRR